jgi:A/G-specific adenine glycosylase
MRNFTNILLKWFESEKRQLPWKETKDPYKIWISEIILQQTRVDQGTAYYLRFLKKFPSINSLAKADEDEVLKMWEGLGYYSRARNIHYTAKYLKTHCNGKFPTSYGDILSLKGIGPYTAAAIMSYAFNKKYAVIDGNVLRIVSRYLGIQEPVDIAATNKLIMSWLENQIDDLRPGDFNQAMMDLGSLICTPKLYKCQICPLNEACMAFKENLQAIIPVKSKSITKKDKYFHYIIFKHEDKGLFIKKRDNGIWKGLYDFPLIEKNSSKPLLIKELNKMLDDFGIVSLDLKIIASIPMPKHVLTHQNIYTFFYTIEIVDNTFEILKEYFIFVDRENITNFAFPKIVNLYLQNHTDF